MRVSNVDIMEQMKKNKDLAIIYAYAIASSSILILGWGVQETFDSSSYISAWDSFNNGKIDMLRTPVYPVFLGVMKIIFGEHFFVWVLFVCNILSSYFHYGISIDLP